MAQISYNKATIYGGDALYDYVWIKNKISTQEEINVINDFYYVPLFDGDTLLLASFNSNINGGNVISLTEPVENWLVYRKKYTDSTLHFVAKVHVTQNSVIDYGVLNNTEYQYVVFAETQNLLSAPLTNPEPIKPNWWNWSIINLKESGTNGLYYADVNNIWRFDCNLASDALTQNLDNYTFNNFTEMPKISSGKMNYITAGVTALLGLVDNEGYSDTIDMQNQFNQFIANGNLKLLRDRKGNGWIVSTTGNSFKYNDVTSEQLTSVSFTFTQLKNINDINVIEEGLFNG